MIHTVDQAVESFLRRAVPLPEASVDVAFDAPDRTWGAGLTRPTVNVFLWQVGRNPSVTTGLDQRVGPDGGIERRRALPMVDLHYLVTSWATEVRDEHQLLGSVLEAVLAADHLAPDDLPERLTGAKCRIGLAAREPANPGELWNSLDGRLKPALQVIVTLPLAVFEWKPTATPAEEVGVVIGRPPGTPADDGRRAPMRRRRAGGALVMEGRPGDHLEAQE